MSRSSRPSPALASAVLLGGIGLSASALAMTDLAQGYALGAQAAVTPPQSTETNAPTPSPPAHAKQAADPAKASEGGCGAKAGDGSCGAHAPATPAKPAAAAAAATPQAKHDDKAMAEGKCGEGKCGGSL